MKKILAVEDSPEIQILIEGALDTHLVIIAPTLGAARQQLANERFDLVLLDIHLPDGDGLDFFSQMQASAELKGVPVFFLTARSETGRKVMAFSLGADDFIAKPFEPAELRARVNAKLRKLDEAATANDLLRVGDLLLSRAKQKIWKIQDGAQLPIALTSLEFRILSLLARHLDRVFSREHLLDEVWGRDTHVVERTVDAHVSHLRKKLTGSRVCIEGVQNEGYRLTIKSAAPPF